MPINQISAYMLKKIYFPTYRMTAVPRRTQPQRDTSEEDSSWMEGCF